MVFEPRALGVAERGAGSHEDFSEQEATPRRPMCWMTRRVASRTLHRPAPTRWLVYLVGWLWSAAAAQGPEASSIPILSVCELLEKVETYRAKPVVVVGEEGWTFEGTFLAGRCAPDGYLRIQGHRWLSLLAVWSTQSFWNGVAQFPVDKQTLRHKLRQIRDARIDASSSASAERVRGGESDGESGDWVALYGRIETPARLKPHRPPRRPGGRNVRGNGYGANGSVPARVIVFSQKMLVPGQKGFAPLKRVPFVLPEPPAIRPSPCLRRFPPDGPDNGG